MATGRPTKYSKAMAAKICKMIRNGGNLETINKNKKMPSKDAIYRWFKLHPSFYDDYVCARELRADFRAHRMGVIAQKAMDKKIDPAAARLAWDNEKWQAGKENPRVYGDKVQHTGPNGNEPIKTETTFIFNPVSKDD